MKTVIMVLVFMLPLTAQNTSLKDGMNQIARNWFQIGLLCGKAIALEGISKADSVPVTASLADFLKTCERYQKDFGVEP